jgi:hypothetical protein
MAAEDKISVFANDNNMYVPSTPGTAPSSSAWVTSPSKKIVFLGFESHIASTCMFLAVIDSISRIQNLLPM